MESKVIPEALSKGYVPIVMEGASNDPISLKAAEKRRPVTDKGIFWMYCIMGVIFFSFVSYLACVCFCSKPMTIESEINMIFGELNISHIVLTLNLESSMEATTQINQTDHGSLQTEKINPTVTTRISTIGDTFNNNGELLFWNRKEWNTTPSTMEHAVVGDRELIPYIPDAVVTEEENPFWGMDRMIDYFQRLAGQVYSFLFHHNAKGSPPIFKVLQCNRL